ncbi:hypothetical protein M569_09010, partial [Genlisea aurea]
WTNLLLFVPGAVTFGLGTWQIFRRQEKIKLLDHRSSRLGMEPLKGDEILISNNDLDSMEFRRIKSKGIYDEKNSVFIGPRSRSISGVTENGYYVITPLLPIQGDVESAQHPILVNRGWVPRSWRDKQPDSSNNDAESTSRNSSSSPRLDQSTATPWWRFWSKKPQAKVPATLSDRAVEVTGVVRGSEKPTIFVPANDPETLQWFYVDAGEIARACGLPEETTVYVEEITTEDVGRGKPRYPVPKDANALIRSSVMPQDHLNYTVTWYTLSAAVTLMAVKRLRPK